MDPLIIGLLVVAASVVYFVVEPLVSGQYAPSGREEGEPSEADFQKRAVLLALRDVDYDYHTGKLDEKDYTVLRGQLSREALETLKGTAEGDQEVELLAGDDPIEAEIRKLRQSLKEGPHCSACGSPASPEDRFCADCGTELSVTAADEADGSAAG